ncbi:unnamed protein product [Auanema sp. JU1783]|nr:unnamed protein product [Auanema sp. JU1783]
MDVDQELVERFKEICAVDDSKARQFLIHCNGELDSAVHLFFQTGGIIGVQAEELFQQNELRRRNVQQSNVSSDRESRGIVPRRQPMGWLEWLLAVASIPLRMTFSAIRDVLSFFFDAIAGRSVPSVIDPKGDVDSFVKKYNEDFSEKTDQLLSFSTSTYDEVLKESMRSLRMLLIYVHDSSPKGNEFVEKIMHGEQFRQLVLEKDLILWGVSSHSGQASSLAQSLRPSGYPHFALLCVKGANKMTRLVHFNAAGKDDDFVCNNLRIAIEYHEAQLNILRLQKAQREEDQRIRAEQEREYQESAAKDRARIQERKRLESEKADAEEKERRSQLEAEERKHEISMRRDAIRESLIGHEEEVKPELDSVRVQVRYPCGARLDKTFTIEDSLEKLFTAIFIHEKCPDFFTAHTTYPRKELICAPDWYHEIKFVHLSAAGDAPGDFIEPKSFKEEGFEKSLVVMIHDCEA